MQIQPYLFFEGRCEEAIEFYRAALGAEVTMMMRFKESPDQAMVQPGSAEKVMHAALRIGETQILMSDGQCRGGDSASFHGFALTVSAASDAEADRLFNALSQGGQIGMPLQKTFFASSFGMVNDRFGVMWMVMAEAKT
jgi:PhnB protein